MARATTESAARALLPDTDDLAVVRAAAAGCQACDLWRTGTQTVFGEGPADARVLLLGEQPGDREDLEGQPFVGPAGRLLDQALVDAGIERSTVYVTNTVKHFKWQARGKRRIHQKPNAAEIAACRPWLEAELALVAPEVVVCLGATAAQALLGRSFRVTQQRGEFVEAPAGLPGDLLITATVHPSSILRSPETREQEYPLLVDDLRKVAAALGGARRP